MIKIPYLRHLFESKKERLVANNPKFKGLLRDIIAEYDRYAHGSKYVPMTLPYRAVHKKVTTNDYYIATEAKFKAISNDNQKIDELDKMWDELKNKGDMTKSPLSNSEYIVIGSKIYRYSDHWGKVGSCYWILENGGENKWVIAVADIKDFKPVDGSDSITMKGYIAVNPEFEKTMLPLIDKTLKNLDEFENEYELGASAIKELNIYRNMMKNSISKYNKIK